MRILIADDNQRLRSAVGKLLSQEPGWSVCGEAVDAPQTVEKACELRPDVILLDISMPGASGFDAARSIRRALPQTKILIMSQNDAARFLPVALEAGADGCLDKARIFGDLINAIRNLQSRPSSGLVST
jgi:DNA-binding NarL/FixJ family response regulator